MIFYHLDRTNTFPANPSEQLIYPFSACNTPDANEFIQISFNRGINKMGERYLNPFYVEDSSYEKLKHTCKNYETFCIEYIFESVRQKYFSESPSRFSSLYACKSLEHLKQWYLILKDNNPDNSKATIKKIEVNNYFVADANWRDTTLTLNGHLVFNPFIIQERAKAYWSGQKCTDKDTIQKEEILCELPVKVLDTLPLSCIL